MNDKLSQTELQAIQAVFSGGNTSTNNGIDQLSDVLENIFCDRLGYKIELYFIDCEILDNDIDSIDLEISNNINRELLSKEYSRKNYSSGATVSDLEQHLFSKIQNNVSKEISKASALLSNFENSEAATLYRFNFEDHIIKLKVPSNYFKSQAPNLSIVAPSVKPEVKEEVVVEANTPSVLSTKLSVVNEKSLVGQINAHLAIHIEDKAIVTLSEMGSVSISLDSLNFEIYNSRESLKVTTYVFIENINLGEMAEKSFNALSDYQFQLVINEAHVEAGSISVLEAQIELKLNSQQEKKGA